MKQTKQDWIIEYEIPPLRAIYRAEMKHCTEEHVRNVIEDIRPQWRIRKIIPKNHSQSRKAFLKLSMKQRREILRKQCTPEMVKHYKDMDL